LLFDGEGHRMTPTHAIKKGTRYRYYVSRPLISESRSDAVEGLRIPAGDIEQLVTIRIGQFLSEPARLFEALAPQVETAAQQRHMLHRATELAATWSELKPVQSRPMLAALIKRIVVRVERIDLLLLPSRIAGLLRDGSPGPASASTELEKEQPVVLSVPVQLRRVGFGIKMLIDETASPGRAARPDPRLIKLIARAHLLNSKFAESKSENLMALAQCQRMTSSYFTRVLRLTFLAPDSTRAILERRHPQDLTARKLLAHSRLPLTWPEQRQILGFG
jgi:site-specific DNA recombinase